MSIESEEFLAHFGVKGMKWGVRKNRESRAIKKASILKSADYVADQQGVADGDPQPKGKWSTKQKIAAGAVFASVGIAALYVAGDYKNLTTKNAQANEPIGFENFLTRAGKSAERNWEDPALSKMTEEIYSRLSENDLVLPPRTKLNRLSTAVETELSDRAYAVFEPDDVQRYRAFFSREASEKMKKKATLYDVNIESLETLRSPSEKRRVDAFIELLDEKSPTGKLAWREYVAVGQHAKSTHEVGLEIYNKMVKKQTKDTPLSKALFDKLRTEGYNMIVDDMDAGVIGSTPVILLDPKATTITKVEALTDLDIKTARNSLFELPNRR